MSALCLTEIQIKKKTLFVNVCVWEGSCRLSSMI